MSKFKATVSLFALLCFLMTLVKPAAAQEVLTNDSVIKMVRVGLTSDLIIQKIKSSSVRFDLTTDGLVALKEAKVPDVVIKAMMSRSESTKAAPPPPPPPPAAPADPAPAPTPASPPAPATPPAQQPSSATAPSPPAAPSDSTPAQFTDAEYLVKAPGQEKPQQLKGILVIDPPSRSMRFLSEGVKQLDINYQNITSLLYERAAKPRYGWGLVVTWPLLVTKSKSHYLTVHYKTAEGSGDFAIIRLHKKNYQVALATIEAQTGMKIERSEER